MIHVMCHGPRPQQHVGATQSVGCQALGDTQSVRRLQTSARYLTTTHVWCPIGVLSSGRCEPIDECALRLEASKVVGAAHCSVVDAPRAWR